MSSDWWRYPRNTLNQQTFSPPANATTVLAAAPGAGTTIVVAQIIQTVSSAANSFAVVYQDTGGNPRLHIDVAQGIAPPVDLNPPLILADGLGFQVVIGLNGPTGIYVAWFAVKTLLLFPQN